MWTGFICNKTPDTSCVRLLQDEYSKVSRTISVVVVEELMWLVARVGFIVPSRCQSIRSSMDLSGFMYEEVGILWTR
jgi:hypothetical protein